MTSLRLRADRQLLRARGSSVRYLLASISAPAAPPRKDRMPVNISLILDRSGSMQGENKFPLAVSAVEQALELLGNADRFSLVVFDDQVDVLMSSTIATADAKKRALRALHQVQPRQSTDLCAGWMHGCEQLSEFVADGVISRALLLTDGQANSGETNHEVLAHHAAELSRRGITTSAFGVGADFDERLLRDIATEGGGNFYFVQRADQIPDLVTSELGEALEVVMRRAELTITVPRGAEATVLNRFRSRRSQGRLGNTIELGDLVSAQELDVVIRMKFPLGELDESVVVTATLGDETSERIEFTYASHGANDEQPRDAVVDREVAKVYAALARAEATEANRHGDYDRARRALVGTARHIEEYAGADRELLALAKSLRDEVSEYAEQQMSPMALKQSFYVAESSMKGRSPQGKARRG
ncbi:MAG: VWA domain-containing protein [Gemmatimonadaceae bacterium]